MDRWNLTFVKISILKTLKLGKCIFCINYIYTCNMNVNLICDNYRKFFQIVTRQNNLFCVENITDDMVFNISVIQWPSKIYKFHIDIFSRCISVNKCLNLNFVFLIESFLLCNQHSMKIENSYQNFLKFEIY